MKRKLLYILLLPLTLLAGCDVFSSEPTYGGLSMSGFNYTPYNLSRFVVTDKYGNKAGGGGDLMPGSGEGSLSCCYKLKGTEFTVDWYVYDADEARKSLRAHKRIQDIHKTTQVHVPPTKVSGGAGERVLGLHFYPDDHVEFEFRNDLRGTRIFYSDVRFWLSTHHGKLLNPNGEHRSVVFRRTARLAAEGWIKYRLTDTEDLKQYVYFTLLNPKFDEHPAVEKILAETKGIPGAFGAAMEKLPASVVDAVKRNKFHSIQKGAAQANPALGIHHVDNQVT
ncbi:hypothetical protein PTE30175_00923 [Pandoraea terrae]|uniref:DUF3304 domain-containing protein n=1 Tax=Pandoraea terrae TaxID=1537710 RepID=A0A5E4SR97_9BURK|nr:DUF3304 domain-containing protein [Pandoraea terrae]VVD78227.1 hypothetical protein PTE30175_00923 [Pandoraea terrae]